MYVGILSDEFLDDELLMMNWVRRMHVCPFDRYCQLPFKEAAPVYISKSNGCLLIFIRSALHDACHHLESSISLQ